MAQLGDARRATAPFHEINVALGAGGYAAQPVQDLAGNTCIDQPGEGAMGIHYVKPAVLFDGEVDALQPVALIYKPTHDGRLRLVGAEYIVFKADWDPRHPGRKPVLFGEVFHEVGRGTVMGCRRSMRCTCGCGSRGPAARSATGTRRCAAPGAGARACA
jgi:hypothetical protein